MSAVVDTLRATLSAAPDSWQARLALIEVLVQEDRPGEAAEVLHVVTELPPDAESQIHAARAYGLLDPAQGIGILEPILEVDPGNGAAHFQKAFLCDRAGDVETARRHYFTATTFDPGLADAKFEARLIGHATPAAPLENAKPDPRHVQPASPQPRMDRDNVRYPAPGEFPVRTLREALGMPPVEPLIDPAGIPQTPALDFEPEPTFQKPAHCPPEKLLESIHNVEVVPKKSEPPVVYDYHEPDDSIFEPELTPDDIYVAALVTETGEPVANLQETLRRNQQDSARNRARAAKRDGVTSAALAIACIVGLVVLLGLIAMAVPVERPPVIVAAVSAQDESTLDVEQLNKPEVRRQIVQPSAASKPMDVVTASAVSEISMPTFNTDGISPGVADFGMEIGTSMTFGPPGGGGETMFFGSKTKGRIAVVFDITGSMYNANPIVIRELKRAYRDAQVVAVFGATFKPMSGKLKLIPYTENDYVRGNVEDNGKRSPAIRDAMNRALFSLSRCDSIDSANKQFLQSLGAAIELLLDQGVDRPETIFVFSDFQDGVDPNYLKKVEKRVKALGVKVVFFHPVKFTKDRPRYEEFAKATGGEVKEDLEKERKKR